MPDKHVHHFNPKKYLRGFTPPGEKSRIWEYARNGAAFNPGIKRGKNNPALISLEKYAGAERDGYACPMPDGTTDYNTYEDKLAKLETTCDRIFDKLRKREMFTTEEKESFTNYIALMMRRGPARRARARELWPKVIEEFETNQLPEIIRELDRLIKATGVTNTKLLQHLHEQREVAFTMIEEYKRSGIPPPIELETMVSSEMTRVCNAITAMRWQIFEAPDGKEFLTSDNPVHTFGGGIGLRRPYSELVFPISSRLALIASYRNVREGFVSTNGHAVKEITRRVLSQAMEYAYGSSAARYGITVLRKKRPRFELLYPYNNEWGEEFLSIGV